jgi:hypothetical protein
MQLAKEFVSMQREPPPFVWASPDENDILICKALYWSRKLNLTNFTGNFLIVHHSLPMICVRIDCIFLSVALLILLTSVENTTA